MFGTDPLEELSIPDGTQIKEHDLVTDGDVFIGGQSAIELGVRGGTVVAGERVSIGGDLEADGDCRLDMWCEIDGNVLVGSDAYLGERVHITGQLIVSGDLDIGDDVEIERGFEANGWIVIRNPVPTIVFLFVYLSHLLRIGENEAAADVASEFLSDDTEAEPVVIPRGSRVSDDRWRVSTPAAIGDGCRLHGNIRAAEIEVGSETEIFGSLRAKGAISVGSGTIIHGDVTTSGGDVAIAPGTHVRGGISCDRCRLSEAAEVEGTIRARDGITLEDTSVAAEAAAGSTADDPASDPPELTPAIVPIGEGSLSKTTASGSADEIGRAFVPLESSAESESESRSDASSGSESEPDPESISTPAVVPLDESDFEWRTVGMARTDDEEHDEDVAAIITDAEDD